MNTSLAIIVTGQLRTFLTKGGSNELLKIIRKSKTTYSLVVIIMVVSGIYNNELLLEVFKDITGIYVEIIDYNYHEKNMLDHVEKLQHNNSFINICQTYLNTQNSAKNEVPYPHTYIKNSMRQLYQIRIGIESIINYETRHDINFDVIMRTRFDIAYPTDFYPNIPTGSLIDKISFNEMGIQFSQKHMSIQEYIIWLKKQNIRLPNCRVSCNWGDSFGGAYLYNYMSLENICNGDDNILYCFNDHFFFSKREVFLKLYDFINIYGTVSNNNIKHIFAEEAQLLIACLHVNINPLMFLPNTYSIIR